MERIFSHIDSNRDKFIGMLQDFCRQESISAQNKGIEETAGAVRKMLSDAGAGTSILKAEGGHPYVCGDIKGRTGKTILFYNHYDVQPPEPLDEWTHPPFGAVIDGGRLYARGAADNKGDFLARLLAVKTFIEVEGAPPVNCRFFVEGEEEIGSPTIEKIIAEKPESVEGDLCIWESGQKTFDGRPVIYLGIKGMLYVELRFGGANQDLHSSVATSVPNPAWNLVWALNTFKDADENIKIDGFYDDVKPLSEKEVSVIRKIPSEDEQLKKKLGLKGFLGGVSGNEKLLRDMNSPTCTICGLNAGYTGGGPKTVLPREAAAKVDFRLVVDQDPDDILRKLKKHLRGIGMEDVRVSVFTSEKPFKTPVDSPEVRAAAETAAEVYGKEPVIHPTMLGTGPMHFVCGKNNTPCMGTGISHAESAIHAPNENVFIEDFIKGIKHIAFMMDRIGQEEGGAADG